MERTNQCTGIRIRLASPDEINRIAEIEAICFPAAEAASLEEFEKRMQAFPENFLVAETNEGELVGFVNGCATDKPVLPDELYHDASLHQRDGRIQTVFGLDVLPDYQHKGIAHKLLGALVELSRERGKDAVILTCKERLIGFYESCGFVKHGLSESCHGGAVWYDMQQWITEEKG